MTPASSRTLAVLALAFLVSCSSKEQLDSVSGAVTIDGQPVDSGTVHIQAVGAETKANAGGAVTNGKFLVESKAGLPPGEYQVVLQAFRKTGRMFDDPQRGKVPETTSVKLADSPQTVDLSVANAADLRLSFTSARP
jgi:hypothetical protein